MMKRDLNIFKSTKQMAVEFNNLSRPDGSAIYSLGGTVVQASMYGPTEVRINKELPDKAYLEVVYRSKSGTSGCADRTIENLIRNSMESIIYVVLYPRTSILIVVQELHNSGCLLASCINAAVLALLDSGISMKGIVAAVGLSILDNQIILNPSEKDEKEAKSCMTFVIAKSELKLIGVTTTGCFSSEQYRHCQELSRKASGDVFTFYKTAVQKRYE